MTEIWVHAANTQAWAIGRPQRNGFHVRKVVWGMLLAKEERRPDEEIRAAKIMVEKEWKSRRMKPTFTPSGSIDG